MAGLPQRTCDDLIFRPLSTVSTRNDPLPGTGQGVFVLLEGAQGARSAASVVTVLGTGAAFTLARE